jgi:hypothetical protein
MAREFHRSDQPPQWDDDPDDNPDEPSEHIFEYAADSTPQTRWLPGTVGRPQPLDVRSTL